MILKVFLTVLTGLVAFAVMAATYPPQAAGKFIAVFVLWFIAYLSIKEIWN